MAMKMTPHHRLPEGAKNDPSPPTIPEAEGVENDPSPPLTEGAENDPSPPTT